MILATPVAEKLHRFYPHAEIDLLVKHGMESLFKGHPFLHEVLTWNKAKKKYRNLDSLIHGIRKSHYDLVINVQRFFSTGLIIGLSGAGRRIGFNKNPLGFLFTDIIPHEIGNGIHETARNLRLIEMLTDKSAEMPRLYPASADEEAIARFKSGKYYTLSPASLWFTKQYPAERWVELIKKADPTSKIYLLGSESDTGLCDQIIKSAQHPGGVNLAGKLTFLQSAALMKGAKMNFTNDSAPMHLASAVNAPVTVVYCSTVPSYGFGPLSDDSAIVEIREDLYCRSCGLHGLKACPEKHFRCALDINADELVNRLG